MYTQKSFITATTPLTVDNKNNIGENYNIEDDNNIRHNKNNDGEHCNIEEENTIRNNNSASDIMLIEIILVLIITSWNIILLETTT